VETENIKTQSSTGVIDVDYLEQPVNTSVVNKNQDLDYLYQQAPISIILSIISALLVCWFVLPSTPDYLYIPWLSFIILTSLTHTLLVKEFNKQKKSLHVNNQWAIYQTFMIGTMALTFSVGYLLFLPLVSTFVQVILLLILATLSVAHLPILSIFLPSYIIYISAFIFPMIFWINSLSPEKAYPIAALLAVTYCILILVASYYSKTLLEAFGLAGRVNKQVKNLYDLVENTKTINVKLKKDVHEYIKKNNAVSRQKEQAEITLQSIDEGVISTDQFGQVVYMNSVAEIYTGWNFKEIKGKCLSKALNLTDRSSHMKLPNPVEHCLNSKATINSTDSSILTRRDGLEYLIDFSTTPVIKDDNLTGAVLVFRDVTEKRSMEKNLDWQAKHDSLTGLINRCEFDNRLNKIISNPDKSERVHALCFINLDRFKLINDSCGHQAGDELLQQISNRLKKLARDTDTIARIGSDEFAIFMYSCSLDKAKSIADVLHDELFNTQFDSNGKHFSITASIGIVPLDDSTESLTELKCIADLACDRAKDKGGNRIYIYDPENTNYPQRHTGELRILEELQHNLEKETFKLYTQKIKPLDDLNDIVFHEVLLRMKNFDGELLSANNFIHTAEAYHMLSSIDNWVLKAVMEMISYGNPLFDNAHMVSINLSHQSVFNDKFINYAVEIFNDYDIPAGNICFEINEPQFYGNADMFNRFVTLIKRQGCKVALDEFNYNPVSINNVKKLAIDYIKLDARQFSDINKNQEFNYNLIESINGINHSAGAQTIIKCIDNSQILESLFEIGTDFVQGYSIEEPKPILNH
jgi:diguanylate cyclase (GGDEF)-like protein/PAS domain S-box-containing protein